MSPSKDQNDLVALVTGANGITGAYLVAQMTKEAHWKRIIATSRRPPLNLPKDPRIEFAQADLSGNKESISEALKDAGATGVTHFFHTAYLHDDSLKKQFELNVPFFRNVLGAVADLNDSTLQRVVLQTGAKHYGFAYKAPTGDPPTGPVTEALGRSAQDGPPNFYYGQEDFMFELQKGKKWTWNVTRPWVIMGFARSGQTYATSAALYFTMCKHLNQPAYFPIRNEHEHNNCYNKQQDVSSATHIARFTTYMALHPEAGNKDFNIVDNDPRAPTFRDYWEFMGRYFGVDVDTKVGFNIQEDAEAKVNDGVWRDIAEKYGVDPEAAERYGTFYFFYWAMCLGNWGCWASMEKARREIGWDQTTDSREELKKIFDEMVEEGTIPDPKKMGSKL